MSSGIGFSFSFRFSLQEEVQGGIDQHNKQEQHQGNGEQRFLTTAVSSGMGYADGLYREALFSIALVLFLFIMLINATLNFFLKRKGERE